MRWIRALVPALVLGLALSASPLLAQGKGKAKKHHGDRPRVEQVSDGWDEDWDGRGDYSYDDAWGRERGNGAGKVPPGWCKGAGNPHNTPENCGYRSDRGYDDWYDDRYPDSRGGSYEREHEDFHRYLDRKYEELAARRPLDIAYQLQLRAQKAAEHDRWHDRTGGRHR